jgi:hypothetical protein
MPGRTPEQKILSEWEYRVQAMGIFEMPAYYKYNTNLNKYDRFSGYVEELVARLVTREADRHPDPFGDLDVDRESFPMEWWNDMIDVMDGKWVRNPIPQIRNASEADKKAVYDELIPAYRALKESFEKRWWFEWIFNHDQYVAERESIKALEGVMLSLTGDTMDELNAALANHREEVPTSGVTKQERSAIIRAEKEERIHEIKLARVQRFVDLGGQGYPLDSTIGSNEWEDLYREVLLVDNAPAINKKAAQDIEKGFDPDDNIAFRALDPKEFPETGKEQVVFANNEFGDLDDSFEIQKPIDEKNDLFIDNEKDDPFIDDENDVPVIDNKSQLGF